MKSTQIHHFPNLHLSTFYWCLSSSQNVRFSFHHPPTSSFSFHNLYTTVHYSNSLFSIDQKILTNFPHLVYLNWCSYITVFVYSLNRTSSKSSLIALYLLLLIFFSLRTKRTFQSILQTTSGQVIKKTNLTITPEHLRSILHCF